MAPQNDIFWVHWIRAISVVFVVWLHVGAQILQLDVSFGSIDWWVGNVADSAVRMCVPLLFMITGFLLVGKEEPLPIFFRKRMAKIAIPLLGWTIFYACWLFFIESKDPTPISPFSAEITAGMTSALPFSLFGFLFAPAYFHLWFMYALIGMYLCLPLLRVLVQNANRQTLWYFIGLWSVATYVIPMLQAAGGFIMIELDMVTGHIGLLVLGYLLGSQPPSKRQYMWMWPIYFASVTITAFGLWWLSSATELNQTFFTGPAILAMTVSSFLILRYTGQYSAWLQSPKIKACVVQLSQCAFGIYLVHAVLLYIFHKGLLGFTLDAVQGSAFLYVPATTLAVYCTSLLIVVVIRKIPYLRALAP